MVTGGSRSDFSLGATDANETNVSFWHFSDIQPALTNVRYWVKRTWRGLISMSAYDPKRTFAATPVMKAFAWEAPSAAAAYQQTCAPEVQT